jgi:hypothetical protein
MCHKGILYLFFIQTSHFRTERQNLVLTVQGFAPRTQSVQNIEKLFFAHGTRLCSRDRVCSCWDISSSCMGWGWGGADKEHGGGPRHHICGYQLARSLGQRLMPLELAVWAQNEPSLLFVKAAVQFPDSWALCTLPLLLAPVRKCLGRVLSCEPLSQVAAQSGLF